MQKQTKLLEWEEIVSSNLNCSGMKSSIDCGHDIENSLTVERLVFYSNEDQKVRIRKTIWYLSPFGLFALSPHNALVEIRKIQLSKINCIFVYNRHLRVFLNSPISFLNFAM